MMKQVFLLLIVVSTSITALGQFSPSAQNWDVPDVEDLPGNVDQLYSTNYGLADFDGDGKLDLIDAEDNASQEVWLNGSQKYWKVHINTGSGFNPSAQNWDIPNIEDLPGNCDQLNTVNYGLADFNGDGKPDLIDMEDNASQEVWLNGSQKYWKVYLNTGSGFNPTAQNWDIPDVEDLPGNCDELNTLNYGLADFNGDGMPDLIDMEDNASQEVWLNGSQKYWKVYINTGSGFNPTAQNWDIPDVEDLPGNCDQLYTTNYGLADFNGDDKPDLIDTEDNASQEVWLNGSQKYWKVYINTGSGFNLTAQNWDIPNVEDLPGNCDELNTINYGLADFDGNGKIDLIDMEDNASQEVWLNGSQKYWKVYINTGSGFNPTAENWDIPDVEDLPGNCDQLATTNYGLADFNGDDKPDLIDAEDNASQEVWLNGSQKYWKVYLNTNTTVSIEDQNLQSLKLKTWPNPTEGAFYIDLNELESPSVEVYNPLGALVYEAQALSDGQFKLDLSNNASGIYYVRVMDGNQLFEAKVLKQ